MNSRKVVPALYGGVIMAVLSATPFLNFINCFCCAGLLAGGFFAVYFYKSTSTPDMHPLTSGECLAVGALAGVFGAIAGTILSEIFMLMFGNVMGEVVRMLQEHGDIPEDLVDRLQEMAETRTSFILMVLGGFARLIVFPIFGLLGGLIGYSMFRPKGMPPQGPGVMPPPPPPGGAVPV